MATTTDRTAETVPNQQPRAVLRGALRLLDRTNWSDARLAPRAIALPPERHSVGGWLAWVPHVDWTASSASGSPALRRSVGADSGESCTRLARRSDEAGHLWSRLGIPNPPVLDLREEGPPRSATRLRTASARGRRRRRTTRPSAGAVLGVQALVREAARGLTRRPAWRHKTCRGKGVGSRSQAADRRRRLGQPRSDWHRTADWQVRPGQRGEQREKD